jgi:hypothetical protein
VSHFHGLCDGTAFGVLAYVPRSSHSILEHREYLELDATFAAVRP